MVGGCVGNVVEMVRSRCSCLTGRSVRLVMVSARFRAACDCEVDLSWCRVRDGADTVIMLRVASWRQVES